MKCTTFECRNDHNLAFLQVRN